VDKASEVVDVVIVGSGAAALTAALTVAAGGLGVLILEKTDRIGGTSAMSGAGTWIPANHHARAAGIADSEAEALTYLRSASPAGWAESEDALWQSFVANAPRMLEFVERHTPLRYGLTREPDPIAEAPGGKLGGRMVSPHPLSRRVVGRYSRLIRRSTLPHRFSYLESHRYDIYHEPFRSALRFAPRLIWRFLTDTAGQGNALVTGLLKGCLDHGCRIVLEARAVSLLTGEPGGSVNGVVVEEKGVRRRILARRGVVLATGGFEWDAGMRERFFPGPLDRIGSPRGNEGDGQRLAASVGARLERMDQANVYPTLPTVYEGRPHGLPMTFQAEPHAIVVDRNARRFVSEYDYNIGEALDRREPLSGEPVHLPAWVIADRRFLRRSPAFRFYAAKEPGWVRRAPSLAALARLIGLPETALLATVERFNGFCSAGRDQDFHRGESAWERSKAKPGPAGSNPTLAPVEQAPFVAIPLNRSLLGTKGGARTDSNGRVLRADGSLIGGLYCAGNAMANPIGTRALGAGTTIGPCMTWGFICGNALLRANRIGGEDAAASAPPTATG
jgi:3-oxosteroid 1-dehydrogenase